MIDDDITRRLRSKDVAERRRVVAQLENQTVFDWVSDRSERDISAYIPALVEALSDDDSGVMDGAMSAIFAAQGDRQDVGAAVPAMLAALEKGGDPRLKMNAVLFLRKEVENGLDISANVPLFEGLLATSGQDDLTLGAADTLAMYYIKRKDWKGVNALLRHDNIEVRQEVVGAIDHSYATDLPRSTMDVLVKYLSDPDDELPLVTALALAPLARDKNDIEVVGRVLLAHARHDDPKHSNTAISGISRLVERAVKCKDGLPRVEWEPLEPLVGFVRDLFQKLENTLSETAAKVLIKYHSHAGHWDAVNKLLLDARPNIRAVCLGHLCNCSIWGCKIDVTLAIPAIVELLPGSKDTVRIVSNLVRDKHLQVPILDAAIRSSKLSVDDAWPYLEIAYRALGCCGWSPYDTKKQLDSLGKRDKLAFVLDVARTRQGEPRRWAIHEIGNLHTFDHVSTRKAIPDLVKFLSDGDPFVQAEAATTIGHMTSHYDTSTAFRDLVRLLSNPAGKVQECAAMALASMAKKGEDISEGLDALASLLLRSTQPEARAQAVIAFYNLAERGVDLTKYHATIVQGLKDTKESARDLCTWAITRYLMNAGNAQDFIDLLRSARIDETSAIALKVQERAKSLLKGS